LISRNFSPQPLSKARPSRAAAESLVVEKRIGRWEKLNR
jgi:hypothetical protein